MRITIFSHPEQRRTMPGPCVKASKVPISPSLPQWAHSVGEAVLSAPKISYSSPAVALASSISSRLISVVSSISASCRATPLGADLVLVDPNFYQRIRRRFDHQRRSADEDLGSFAQWTGSFLQHLRIDAPCEALPTCRLGAGQRVEDRKSVV